jgi:hypothetical protein
MSKHRFNISNRRRQNMMYVFLSRPVKEITKPSHEVNLPKGNGILIFKSELDYISRCILDRKNIETGGQLFGYWSEDGRPVVMYAIGPGPKANHQTTFFNQDVDYLVTVGRFLKENFGLKHIGEWHSHHQLGLAKPSGHDVNTMVSTIREKDLGQFLLCIGNCDRHSSSLNGYICDSSTCTRKEWDVIHSESPIRQEIDTKMESVLKHPTTASAVHTDEALNDKPSKPEYAKEYWLKEPGAPTCLNEITNYLKRRHPRAEVKVQMNALGEVQLEIKKDYQVERILFPQGFPRVAPIVRCYFNGRLIDEGNSQYWHYHKGNITGSFIHYYETI